MRQFTDTDVQLGLFDEQAFPEPPRPPSRVVLGITDVGWFWTGYFALILLFISIGIYYWQGATNETTIPQPVRQALGAGHCE